MGYRSDVCLCLKKNALAILEDGLSLGNISQMRSVSALLADSETITDPDKGDKLWFWSDIKWYPDYEDVAYIESSLSAMNKTDYLFIRIGEDSDDSEVQGCYWDNSFGLYLERRISFERPDNGNC